MNEDFAARISRIEARNGKSADAPAADRTPTKAPTRASAAPLRAVAPAPRRKRPIVPIALLFTVAVGVGLFFDDIMAQIEDGGHAASVAGFFGRDQPFILEGALESRMTPEESRAMDDNTWIDEQLEGTRSESSRLARMILSN